MSRLSNVRMEHVMMVMVVTQFAKLKSVGHVQLMGAHQYVVMHYYEVTRHVMTKELVGVTHHVMDQTQATFVVIKNQHYACPYVVMVL